MTWKELKQTIDALLVREGLSEDTEVRLDMEPDQDIKNWGITTRFDGEKSVILTSMEYDAEKQYWWMTCIRCDRSHLVYGMRTVCYECDPALFPRNPENFSGETL